MKLKPVLLLLLACNMNAFLPQALLAETCSEEFDRNPEALKKLQEEETRYKKFIKLHKIGGIVRINSIRHNGRTGIIIGMRKFVASCYNGPDIWPSVVFLKDSHPLDLDNFGKGEFEIKELE